MAGLDIPGGIVQQAIRDGRSATDALRLYRQAGGQVRTQTWYRLYGQARLEGFHASAEMDRPLHRTPVTGEIQTMTTRNARGFLQRVVVMGRDKDGTVIAKHISLRTDRLVSRRHAMQHAIDLVATAPVDAPSGGLTAIGAVYGGTFDLQPE